MKTGRLVFWAGLFALAAASANTAPKIEKFFAAKQLQGEEGIEQIVLRGVARDAEDGPNLKYEYRIVSGGGVLEPVRRYAVYHPDRDGLAVFELTVTDAAGASDRATTEYRVGKIDSKKLYLDKPTWLSALTSKYRKQAAFQFVERDPNLPNVLLIGDSISIGYTPFVREALKGKANVYRIPENGGDSKKALMQFEYWMGNNDWDVIHFNTGLHDMKRIVNNQLDIRGDHVNSQTEYRANLERYFQRLEATGAKLIWASTTVVPDGADGRIKGEEVEYNQVARDVLEGFPGIAVDDLYTFSAAHQTLQRPGNVHFEVEGSRLMGAEVAKVILQALE